MGVVVRIKTSKNKKDANQRRRRRRRRRRTFEFISSNLQDEQFGRNLSKVKARHDSNGVDVIAPRMFNKIKEKQYSKKKSSEQVKINVAPGDPLLIASDGFPLPLSSVSCHSHNTSIFPKDDRLHEEAIEITFSRHFDTHDL